MLLQPHRPQLLVSVRNRHEAVAAVDGGADIIDIKEPSRGPLGMAEVSTASEVIQAVAGRRPVTMALGELGAAALPHLPEGLAAVKVGLAHAPSNWPDDCIRLAQTLGSLPLIAVAYADHHRCAAPPLPEVLAAAIGWGAPGLLIDTARKDGRDLLTLVDAGELQRLVDAAHGAGLLLALAGSLRPATIDRVLEVAPDVIAVRGAACRGADRSASIQRELVEALRQQLRSQACRSSSSA